MKLLCFPVKGFGGLSLTFSEAFGVVVATVSGIVSFGIGVVCLLGCQSFVLGVEKSGVIKSRF
jgi:hypothetical protein